MGLKEVEEFLKLYPNLINSIGVTGGWLAAIATFWAVKTSLKIAKLANRPSLEVLIDVSQLVDPIGKKRLSDAITINIRNSGGVSARINLMGGFSGKNYLKKFLFIKEYSILFKPIEPDCRFVSDLKVANSASECVILTRSFTELRDKLLLFKSNVAFLNRLQVRFISFYVYTQCGQTFKAKVGKSLKLLLVKGQYLSPQE